MSAFQDTRNLFISYTNYVRPLSYDDWAKLPRTHMAAVLFVQFHDEITLAWYKTKSFYALEEDGVSTICQYLEKNVSVLLENPNRFTSAYIYRVAFNCLYCICHDIKRDRERWEHEVSNIIQNGEDEFDVFDTISTPAADATFFKDRARQRVWSTIEEGGLEFEKVVNHLLDGEPLTKSRKIKNRTALDDIEVSVSRLEEIVGILKDQLADLKDEL